MEKTSSDFELACQWMALCIPEVENWVRKALLDRGYQLLTLVWSTLNLEVGMKKLSRYIQVKVIICLQKLTHSSYDHIYSGVVVLQYSSILGVFWPVKYELEFLLFRLTNDTTVKQ